MKTLLLTGYDNKMAPLGDLTSPIMLAYASRHGFDFKCFRQFPEGKPAYWEKIPQILDAFESAYERIIWLDADQVITNPEYVPSFENGVHFSLDWGQDATDPGDLSMCGFVAHIDSVELFEQIQAMEEQYINGPFPEQAPTRWLYKNNDYFKKMMHVHSSRLFNSVPVEVHSSVVQPWNLRCFTAHITMVDIEKRVEIFHKIREQMK